MKLLLLATVVTLGVVLAGCGRPSGQASERHGRYVGVGIYTPGDLWSKMVAADGAAVAAAPTPAAKTTDDEQVIVVVDSDTGEIRQCGNLSGYCVGMNPWTKALTAAQTAPVRLTAHAAELAPAR